MLCKGVSLFLTVLLLFAVLPATYGEEAAYEPFFESGEEVLDTLETRLNSLTTRVYVYSEAGSTLNHFTQKALMAGNDTKLIHDMEENCAEAPYAGGTCIRGVCEAVLNDWGGWMFLNGYLEAGQTEAGLNDGTVPGQGLDLTGAEKLVFYARGEKGGETVEFFTAGFGRSAEWGTPTVEYPDSAKKQTLGFITLSKDWTRYEIDLTEEDMSDICCGFGFVVTGDTGGAGTRTFYLDEIYFEGSFENTHPQLYSYDTENIYIKNAAFLYDNAMAALAFTAAGRQEEAKLLLDSFVYAAENDRYQAGRLRNAYAAGDITGFSGWANSAARLPGWYDFEAKTWYEDRYQTGSNVGNTCFAVLALLQYDLKYGAPEYVTLACTLMDRILEECADANPGFIAGYDGWPEGGEETVYPLTYKSTEHNIDAYAVFSRLYTLTGEEKYKAAAESALTFIYSMYDAENHYFYTGTGTDGVTPNKSVTVLDTEVWNALALGELFEPYADTLSTAEKCRTPEGGYGFTVTDGTKGWWAEGTAFTALMYRVRGETEKAVEILTVLKNAQAENGLFYAASQDGLPTGLDLFDGSPWTYDRSTHIAPAAWYVLAVYGMNPYRF